MINIGAVAAVAVAAGLGVSAAWSAGPFSSASEEARDAARRSGFDFMTPAIQAMQRDDAQNPAMLWVKDGEALWNGKGDSAAAGGGRSCAGCHGDARASMRGVAARYPAYDEKLGRPVNLQERIGLCRSERQQALPLAPESKDLLSLESYVALQSRGMPIAPPADARLTPFRERGRARFMQRVGQLDLACAHCHDERSGKRLGGSVIPQAQATAYPIYRLEWQELGSLQRRLRNCLNGVRAEAFPYGAQELVELEAYLATRAAGMPVESPGVRP